MPRACRFRYEAEDFTHFHLSGWNPFQSDVVAAVERLKLTPDIHETGGAKTAEKALRERVEERVQIAWVEDYSVLAVAAVDDDTVKVYDRQLHDASPRTNSPSAAGGSASRSTGCWRSSPASRTSTAPSALG